MFCKGENQKPILWKFSCHRNSVLNIDIGRSKKSPFNNPLSEYRKSFKIRFRTKTKSHLSWYLVAPSASLNRTISAAFCADPFDITSPNCQLIFTIAGSASAFYCSVLYSVMSAGIARYKNNARSSKVIPSSVQETNH